MLGVDELVIFDPHAAGREGRTPLQVFRRLEDGAFALVERGDGPLFCRTLNAWLAPEPLGPQTVLRLALDPEGRQLVPTEAEALKQVEAERDRERQAREAAEQELARLRAELEQRREG